MKAHSLLLMLAGGWLVLACSLSADENADVAALREEVKELRNERDRLSDLVWAKDRYANYRWWLANSVDIERRNAKDAWQAELSAYIEAQKAARDVFGKLIDTIEGKAEPEVRREAVKHARAIEDFVRLADMKLGFARQVYALEEDMIKWEVADAGKLIEHLRQLNLRVANTREDQLDAQNRLEQLQR